MWQSGFEGDFPENGNFNCFGLGLSPRNVTKQWEFQNCRCFATMLLLWKYWRSHSFTHMKFFVRYKHAHLFCRCVLREYHGLFLHRSAAFFVLRLLRSFVERFYLSKKHDCKNPECVNLSFKELVWRGRVLGILALATKCYEHSPSPNLKRTLVENTLAENPEENRNNEKSQKCL